MKKVLLVNCNTVKVPYPVPPIGLCLLAASLEVTWEVNIYDCMFDEVAGLVEKVLQFTPDYIGFSIRNIDSTMSDSCDYYVNYQVFSVIQPIKKITSAKIILGGSGFSIFPKELMDLTKADYGVIGEGEGAFRKLLETIERGESVFPSGNIIVGGTLWENFLGKPNLTELISDRFSTIDLKIEFSQYSEKGAYSIQTKRGCSHKCIYCTYPFLEGKIFRTRKPKDIADEIEQAQERLGNVVFEFVDSTFNDPKGHAEVICQEIIDRKLKLRLRTMGINPRNASEKLFELMMEAGFVQIDATPDTASPSLLTNLGKGFNIDEIRQMANAIRKLNLPTMWFFLFGGPGENEETFKETLDFIDTYVSQEDLVYMASGLRIYPNTPLEKRALQEKQITSGQSLLFPPLFYFSNEISKDRLTSMISDASVQRFNCIDSAGTRPSREMLQEANRIRKEQKSQEPMFRTLLKIRNEWKEKGLLGKL